MPYKLLGVVALSLYLVGVVGCAGDVQPYQLEPMAGPNETLYVSPLGNDAANGTRQSPLKTLQAAWRKIPATRDKPWRVALLPGTYPYIDGQNSLFDRKGPANAPLLVNAADGAGTVTIEGGLSFGRVSNLVLEGLILQVKAGGPRVSNNVLQIQASDAVTVQRSRILGPNPAQYPDNYDIQETLKVNQVKNFTLLNSEVSGSFQTSLDFVAVQGARVEGNLLRNSGQWCGYVKGGSANIVVTRNRMTRCAVGGFSAGEGSGLDFHVLPYVTYETYGVQITNNLFYNMPGHGVGVQGGYNTLIAHNTFYNVASSPVGYGLIAIAHGLRGCYDQAVCASAVAAGGWSVGPGATEQAPIPNKHTWIFNNVFYNANVVTRYTTLAIWPSRRQIPQAINIPNPARTDADLRISGNVIWNPGRELGVGGPNQGCQNSNPTCNQSMILANNTFNLEPDLLEPDIRDFRPQAGGFVVNAPTISIPNFSWADAPRGVPAGLANNAVTSDFRGRTRSGQAVAGALLPPP